MLRANYRLSTVCPHDSIMPAAGISCEVHWVPIFKLFMRVGGSGVGMIAVSHLLCGNVSIPSLGSGTQPC